MAQALGKIRFDEELIEIMYEAKREMYQDRFSYSEAIQKRLQGQLEALGRQETKLFEDSSAGILSPDFYERQMLSIRNKKIVLQKELKELNIENGLSTLEPIKSAFLQANSMQNRFLEAGPVEQKRVASEVLWNLLVQDGQTQEARYKSFYKVLAEAPKSGDLESLLAA